jgi:hypothetical protein
MNLQLAQSVARMVLGVAALVTPLESMRSRMRDDHR